MIPSPNAAGPARLEPRQQRFDGRARHAKRESLPGDPAAAFLGRETVHGAPPGTNPFVEFTTFDGDRQHRVTGNVAGSRAIPMANRSNAAKQTKRSALWKESRV